MADRYWVGGTGTWDNAATTNWSATSGGSSGASAPTNTDNVFFDDNSGSNYTVTITSGTCADFTATKPSGGTLTFAGGANFTTKGNFTVGAGITWSHTGTLIFAAATTGKTITTNGVTFPGSFNFATAGNGYQLQDNLTSSSTTSLLTCKGTVSLTALLDLNGFTLTVGTVNLSGAALTTLAFGATGVINVTGNGATVWSVGIASGLTVTGNPVVNFTYNGSTGTRTIQQGSSIPSGTPEANSITFNITAGSDIVSIAGSTKNLNTTGFSGSLANLTRTIYGNLIIGSATTVTAGTAATTFAATSGTKTITTNGVTIDTPITFNGAGGTWQLQDNLIMSNGSANTTVLTLTAGNLDLNGKLANAYAFNTNSGTLRSINLNGGNINLLGNTTQLWYAPNVTNFSYTGTGYVNMITSASTGNRAINHGQTGGSAATAMPPINVKSGSDGILLGNAAMVTYFSDINTVGFTGTTYNFTRYLTGNLKLGATGSMGSSNSPTIFIGTGNQYLDNSNRTSVFPVRIQSTGNVILANNFNNFAATGFSYIWQNTGNLYANGYNITTGNMSSTSTVANSIINISNTTVTLYQSNMNVWAVDNPANVTILASNSSIVFGNAFTANRTFAGGGETYGNLVLSGAQSSNTTITGNNTFDTISSTKTVAHGVVFQSGDTQTMRNFTVTGRANNIVTIKSTTAGQKHNLVLTGGGNINTVNYLNITDSNASPGLTWYAGANSINGGNVVGWIFPSTGSSNFFLVF